jgi:hypothetical protein
VFQRFSIRRLLLGRFIANDLPPVLRYCLGNYRAQILSGQFFDDFIGGVLESEAGMLHQIRGQPKECIERLDAAAWIDLPAFLSGFEAGSFRPTGLGTR